MGRRIVKRGPTVEAVSVDAAPMLTIDTTIDEETIDLPIRGAYVRLRPVPSDTPDRLKQLKAVLLELGARTVKLMPIPKGGGAVLDAPPSQAVDTKTMREVVYARLKRARNVGDKKAIKACLDAAMEGTGL